MNDGDSETVLATIGCTPSAPVQRERGCPRRISLVGTTGSGKTHLARLLAEKSGIPLYELDLLRKTPDGRERSSTEFFATVSEIVARDEWIMDGHYRLIRHMVWKRADQIVWLDYPLLFTARRLLGRYFRNRIARQQLPTGASGAATASESASWATRVRRFIRALREQREYAALLRDSEYADAFIIRLHNQPTTHAFMQAAGDRSADYAPPLLNSAGSSVRIIELFGLPGSGKSTLADALAQQFTCLTRAELSVRWARQSGLRKAYLIMRGLTDLHILKAALGFAITARLSSSDSLFRLVRMIAKSHWIRTQSGTLLMDQSYLQDIWSILYGSRAPGDYHASIAALMAAMFRHTRPMILYLDLAPDLSAVRVAERDSGNSRLDHLPVEQVREQLVEANWIPAQILKAVGKAGLPVKSLDAGDTTRNIAAKALAAIAQDDFSDAGQR